MLLPNIHILGIQGSGKGTQSELLVERYDLSYISSGDLFRQRSASDDEFGLTIRHELTTGRLLKDEFLFHTVEEYLENQPTQIGLLGDGVIRTVNQFEGLEEIWNSHGLDEPMLIHLMLSEEVALQRIAHRQQEQADPNRQQHYFQYGGKLLKRTDDNPAAISERFRLFHEMTEPVIWAFEHNGRCANISAERSVDEIQTDIRNAIEQYYPQLSHVTD